MKRQEIVDAARYFVERKTRWANMGRDERRLDCYGLVIKVREKFGLPSENVGRYGIYPSNDLDLVEIGRRMFDQVHPPLKPGMVAVFRFGQRPWHMGVVGEKDGRTTIIHVAANRKFASEDLFADTLKRTFRAAFDFRGVED